MLSKIKPVCQEFRLVLWLYLDKEMSPKELEYWDSHLGQCRECRMTLEENKSVLTAYEALVQEEPGGELFAKMVDKALSKHRMPFWLYSIRQQIRQLPYHPLQFAYKSAFVLTIVIAAVLISFNRDSSDNAALPEKTENQRVTGSGDTSANRDALLVDNAPVNGKETGEMPSPSRRENRKQGKGLDWKASEVNRKMDNLDKTINKLHRRDIRKSPGIKDVIDEWTVSVVSIQEGIEKLQRELKESSSL